MSIPLAITDNAKARLAEITAQKDGAMGIRLYIAKGKGCGGNEYRMEHVSEEKAGHDKIDLGNGAALYIPVEDSFHMFNMEIDFVTDDLSNSQFTFMNPNEAGRCGCGISFSLDPDQEMDETGACGF